MTINAHLFAKVSHKLYFLQKKMILISEIASSIWAAMPMAQFLYFWGL